MAINDCVISGPDPGAVPGASTTSPFEDGFLWGRNRIDGRVKTVLSPGMVPPLSG